ncbi:MAG: HAMP domain-containing protein [Rhizobiales bacterium]|nr:HAMP domain-containing protein [Hyphomicrobiales bacterium]
MVAILDSDESQGATSGLGGRLRRFGQSLWSFLPKGLYARALIIIIAPMVLLQSVVAFIFMERHWEAMTRRLSEATAGSIAAVIDMYQDYGEQDNYAGLIEVARQRMGLSVQVLPKGELPPERPRPYFDLLDRTLSNELARHVSRPYWIDTVGRSRHVEIQIRLEDAVLRFITHRSQTYASNSHIFLIWMVGTSLVLLTVAILFLHNQIKPVVRLAEAADAFGKGRPVPEDFRARGAREVRQAASAFIEMRDRIERHVEQRTAMLAGVSHDLRTILTRFRLELAMIDGRVDTDALKSDVEEMQAMLEDYMSFAKGSSGEETALHDVRALIAEIEQEAARLSRRFELKMAHDGPMVVSIKRRALKRAITNLVTNAVRYAKTVQVSVGLDGHWLRIEVDDDGPGIVADKREEVFRPFYRLDTARNQDVGNTGLGLAISRDIARTHGGDIWLEDSPLGGLKAIIQVPV